MKILIYTTNIGNYDDNRLVDVSKHPNIDFKTFTKNDSKLSNSELSRYYKFNYFNDDYDILLYIDGTFDVINLDLLQHICKDFHQKDLSSRWYNHPYRNSILQEIVEIKKRSKIYNIEGVARFKDMIQDDKSLNFLFENSCFLKKNNDELKVVMDEIYKLYLKLGRDQLALPYIFRKLNYKNYESYNVSERNLFLKLNKHL